MPEAPHTPDLFEAKPVRTVYSVSQLNAQVRELLEHSFPLMWIEGEVSRFQAHPSSHWYFSLKDAHSVVDCAMFRMRNQLVGFRPKDGQQILLRARVSLFEARGRFQLVVEHMEESGEGALRRAIEELKKKLQAEGLFEASRKKPVPPLPARIGIITSATGAAIRDVLHVLQRRNPLADVVVYPVPVQGREAAPAIVRALKTAARRAESDVLLLVRGGGSLEDLQAFNEEAVARAIADCPIPLVSGVGHEIDFTIADFVADLRAPTPSAAAELVSPDQLQWTARLQRLKQSLAQCQNRQLQQAMQRYDWLSRRLLQIQPARHLERLVQRLNQVEQRMGSAIKHALGVKGNALALASRHLDALSPLRVLERGYAVATLGDGRVLRSAAETKAGDDLRLTLLKGRVDCRVTAAHSEEK